MQKAEFLITPSKTVVYFLHSVYILAILIVATLSITLLWKIVGCLFLSWCWNKDCLIYHPCQPITISHEQNIRFDIETQQGVQMVGLLKGDSFKCPWFIILRLKIVGPMGRKISIQSPTLKQCAYSKKQFNQFTRTSTIFIARDSLTHLEYRVLCARLLSF